MLQPIGDRVIVEVKEAEEQIEAFRDTSYDGILNNHGKHSQFANYK